MTRFVIAGVQRSGTTVTQRIVQEHPQACMAWAEIGIDAFFGQGYSAWTFGNEAYAEREAAFPALFDAISRLHATDRTRACGIKVAVHGREQAMLLGGALREFLPDVKLVLTVRNDLVAQFASLQRARQTGEWHSWSRPAASGDELTLDRDAFVEYATETRAAIEHLRELRHEIDVHEVGYERDILGGTDPGDLFAFLGIERIPVTWKTTQKTAPAARDYVTNYDELVTALAEVPSTDPAALREEARSRSLERAAAEHDYVIVRRAERWLARGDASLAADLAAVALRTGDATPRRTWLPCALILDEARRRGVGRVTSPSVDAQNLLDALATTDSFDPVLAIAAEEDVPTTLGLAVSSLERGQHDLAEGLVLGVLAREPLPHRDETEWAAQLLEQCWTAAPSPAQFESSAALTERFNDDPAIWFLHALTARATGRRDAERAALERTLELDPGRTRARDLLG